MCCILCCCCDTCNSYSSKCVELFIFTISLLSLILTFFIFFYINAKHITLICYVILIALIVFSFLILTCIGLIVYWRCKGMITTKRIKVGEGFSIVGLILTIFYLICIASLVSLMYTHYEELNHPCLLIEKEENGIKVSPEYGISSDVITKDFCIENPDYSVNIVPRIEYIIPFVIAAILCIFNLILIYFWFNDYRRIKFLIEGSLNDFDAQAIKNETNKNNDNENSFDKGVNERINKRQNKQLNNKYLYKIYSQQENGIRYDIYGRPIIITSKENYNIANTKDHLNTGFTQRYSKKKNMLNNRVTIFNRRGSIKPGINNDIGHSGSSERNVMNNLQFTRNITNNYNFSKSKTTDKAN